MPEQPNQSLRGVLMRYFTVIDYSRVPDSNYPQVNIAAFDPSRHERLIEDATRRPDERASLDVLTIARLLAHHDHARCRKARRSHQLPPTAAHPAKPQRSPSPQRQRHQCQGRGELGRSPEDNCRPHPRRFQSPPFARVPSAWARPECARAHRTGRRRDKVRSS